MLFLISENVVFSVKRKRERERDWTKCLICRYLLLIRCFNNTSFSFQLSFVTKNHKWYCCPRYFSNVILYGFIELIKMWWNASSIISMIYL